MKKSVLVPSVAVTMIVAAVAFTKLRANMGEQGAPPNPLVVGHARFTVITPNCIRIEYANEDQFVDAPSLFAVNRDKRFNDFKVTHDGSTTTIETDAVRLSYIDDGAPLSDSNLRATIKSGAGFTSKVWMPNSKSGDNLGGTTQTLDNVRGPVDTGQGVLSRDGWYLLDDSGQPLLQKDWVAARPPGAGTDWYLFGYGHDYRAALKSLTAIGGNVPLPRRNLLGAWYSRYWDYTDNQFRQIVKEYHQHDFPLDNMVLDMNWHREGWTGWSWNFKSIPNPPKLMSDLHAQGLQTTLNLHPADGVNSQEDRYKQFMAAIGKPADGKTEPLDVANKTHMTALFQQVMAPVKKAGVDFWWLDWQQYPQTRSIPSLTNLWWFNEMLMRDTQAGGRRGVAFSRWAGWGDHRHPIHFSGDASTAFSMLAFEVPYTSMAGNVGCFFWSHDIGGHQDGRNEESYARWCQFGALSAALRSHSTKDPLTDRRPWNYPNWAEKSMQTSFHLRSELFPYIYSSVAQSTRDSIPLNRPLYLDAPNEEASYQNGQEFLFGDNLLVAPIVSAGVGQSRVSHQSVYFPQGTWFNTFSGERFQGGATALCAATIDEFPLFARGGMPIPMQPYTQRMTSTPLSTLRVAIYPGANGQVGKSQLYEDDGDSEAYKNGASATTDLTYQRIGDDVTIRVEPTKGKFKGQLAARALRIELRATQRVTSATVDNAKVAVKFDAATSTNIIEVPSRPISQAVNVKVTVADADSSILTQKAQAKRLSALTGKTFAPQTSRELLKQAVAANLSGPELNEAFAVVGVGVVRKNLSPTFMNGPISDVVYAPQGVLDDAPQVSTTPANADSPISTSHAKIKIGGKALTLPIGPIEANNVAPLAKVSVSGVEKGYGQAGATDGDVDGYPDNRNAEWSSGQKEGSTIRLYWSKPQVVNRVALFDRVNMTDQITSGILTFSDSSSIPTAALNNDGKTPLTLTFAPKTITWLEFKVTSVSPPTEGVGLAEIAVYKAK